VLIKAGADVTQVNDYGRTALHYAAMQGNYYACSGGPPFDLVDGLVLRALPHAQALCWQRASPRLSGLQQQRCCKAPIQPLLLLSPPSPLLP
jgi:hypothetical protein